MTAITQHPELREGEREQDATPRFDALVDELGATYPLLAPAAAAMVDNEADAFDEQIYAGLVNL